MKIQTFDIEGPKLIELKTFPDERGTFTERFQEKTFERLGLPSKFIQDNQSRSLPKVVRGLHLQKPPFSQGKLVGVIRGRIFDVAVDLRTDSKTHGRHVAVELDEKHLFWIPPGFAHGFCVIGDEPADVLYKIDQPFMPDSDIGVRYDDPDLGIQWPIKNPILSKKDQNLPSLRELLQLKIRW
ncbi:MAG: dTDP-4-dehydrorhamnose 3,5-epimerase [Bdellovibrionales bacterium]|nr:dTDP-4-dehydrorhamnose 3,5-epimerase [Bdellovibrionales bacterium]